VARELGAAGEDAAVRGPDGAVPRRGQRRGGTRAPRGDDGAEHQPAGASRHASGLPEAEGSMPIARETCLSGRGRRRGDLARTAEGRASDVQGPPAGLRGLAAALAALAFLDVPAQLGVLLVAPRQETRLAAGLTGAPLRRAPGLHSLQAHGTRLGPVGAGRVRAEDREGSLRRRRARAAREEERAGDEEQQASAAQGGGPFSRPKRRRRRRWSCHSSCHSSFRWSFHWSFRSNSSRCRWLALRTRGSRPSRGR